MKPFLLSVLLILPLVARANDSSFEGVGGSLQPTRGENKAIRMVRETVVLTANRDDFSTRADFVFSNETGRAQSVSMGFPEGNFGDVASAGTPTKSGFRNFVTLVDGRRTTARRTILKEADKSGFDTYWIKTVSFAPRQTRRVRVEFRSPYGGTTNWGLTNALSYSFTGANWRGNVGESVLEVRVTQPGLWRVVGYGEEQVLPFSLKSDAHGATFRRVWKNWNAQKNITFGLERAVPFWRVEATDNGSQTLKNVAATQTVRIRAKPKAMEGSQGFPVQGFSRDGIFYIGVGYLENKLATWGDEMNPKFEPNLSFSAATGFDLRAGKLRLQGRKGEPVIQVNGKSVKTPAPIMGVMNGETEYLYVPLAPLARELGWKYALIGERLFSLERGNWHG